MIYFDIYLFFPTIVGPLWFHTISFRSSPASGALLAASPLARDSYSATFPRIFEQKRDCSQSKPSVEQLASVFEIKFIFKGNRQQIFHIFNLSQTKHRHFNLCHTTNVLGELKRFFHPRLFYSSKCTGISRHRLPLVQNIFR